VDLRRHADQVAERGQYLMVELDGDSS